MELHDTAQVQLQLMDGDKVIHSEEATVALRGAADGCGKFLEGTGAGSRARVSENTDLSPLALTSNSLTTMLPNAPAELGRLTTVFVFAPNCD